MKAFTLIEFLVVCSIVLVLIGMSLSAYDRAKNRAQKVACMVAIRSYAMRYSEHGRLVVVIPE